MGNKQMRVLVACEFSGRVRRAFASRGHEVYSCDLIPSEDDSPHHITGDVLDHLHDRWDLLIAHPPCTYLANSGVRHMHSDPARWDRMREGAAFFNTLWQSHIPRVCVENPIQHGYARDLIGRCTQTIQPWQFGHPETKATCLWLKGLPKLTPTRVIDLSLYRNAGHPTGLVHRVGPSVERWKIRSRTYLGIAQAMSEQWG